MRGVIMVEAHGLFRVPIRQNTVLAVRGVFFHLFSIVRVLAHSSCLVLRCLERLMFLQECSEHFDT